MLAGSLLYVVTYSVGQVKQRLTELLQRLLGCQSVEDYVLVEDHDVHVADDQLAALGLHLSVLPHAVSGVVLEHVDLQGDKNQSTLHPNFITQG